MSSSTVYQIGQQPVLTATFKNEAGALTDPSTVTAFLRKPSGAVTNPATTHAGLGVWTTKVTVDQPGSWSVRFEGTGALIASVEQTFVVKPSAFYPSGA